MARDNKWLKSRLELIWDAYFPDVPKENYVRTRFKGKWRTKFGHISLLKNKDSEIVVNGAFKDERVPEYVVNLTLAHELTHYAQGFGSPLPKNFKYPHQGGVVDKELKQRGLGDQLSLSEDWIKKKWWALYDELHPSKVKQKKVRSILDIFRF